MGKITNGRTKKNKKHANKTSKQQTNDIKQK